VRLRQVVPPQVHRDEAEQHAEMRSLCLLPLHNQHQNKNKHNYNEMKKSIIIIRNNRSMK
jgi:hypothetical protein